MKQASTRTKLESLVASKGNVIEVDGRPFLVEGVSADGDIALGTFRSKRASHTGIRCNMATVAGRPGAEVWSIISASGRELAKFAVHNDSIVAISH